MIWYGFNEEDSVVCEDMFEGQFEELIAHSRKEENRNRYYLSERGLRGRHEAAAEKFLFERAKGGRKEERKENAIERLFRELEAFLDYEGNAERDESLGPALNEARAEYERAKVHGIAITPVTAQQREVIAVHLRDIDYAYLRYINEDDAELPGEILDETAMIRAILGIPESPPYEREEAAMEREMTGE